MAEDGQAFYEPLTERELDVLRLIADGYSNREIADDLFISVNTVRWYNKQIYAKIGVHSRTAVVARADSLGLLDGESTPATDEIPVSHLPAQLTTFVGRQREIDQALALLAKTRLLTLTGPGGTGKTRLSIEVAKAASGEFAGGVYFVDLAPIASPSLVPQAIATALEVVENADETILNTLKRALADQEMLLLIDNYEHVIEAAPVVSDLLAAAPRLKALVTSRETLRLSGEQEYPVPSLSLPSDDTDSAEAIIQSEAVTLFLQRAQMARPGFALDDDNAATIARICARLDGLPLGIELAAARCKLLTPQALLARLDSRLTTLTGGSRNVPDRQQTLRDTIAWSYNLLDAGEKALFARMAVFRGGRSLEALEAVCSEGLPVDLFDALASLLDKSMIRQVEDTTGEPRFVMLETIQEYAWEQLERSGEADSMRRRHAAYFTDLAERAEPELRQSQQVRWFHRLETEFDNIREALAWSVSGNATELGARLAEAISFFWYWHGYHVEGRRWAERLLEQIETIPVEYHIKVYLFAALMAASHTDLEIAKQRYTKALEIARQTEDDEFPWAMAFLAYASLETPATAIPMAEEALALFRAQGNRPGIAQTLNIIGEISRHNGDDERALAAYEECLALCRETGETYRIGMMYQNLAYIAQHRDDHAQAKALARQGVAVYRDAGSHRGIANSLAVLAGTIGMTGEPARAARLFGAVDMAFKRMGAFLQPADQPEYDRNVEAVRAQLDPEIFESAWAEGSRWSLQAAVEVALRD